MKFRDVFHLNGVYGTISCAQTASHTSARVNTGTPREKISYELHQDTVVPSTELHTANRKILKVMHSEVVYVAGKIYLREFLRCKTP